MRDEGHLGKGTASGATGPARQPPDPHAPHEVVGIDALSPLLASVHFPTDKRGILGAIGDPQVPVSKTHTRPLSAILNDVAPEHFASAAEVELAVQRLWDDVAQRTGRGGRQPQTGDLGGRPKSTTPEEGGMPRERHRNTNQGDPRSS